MTDERALERGNEDPLTEDDLAIQPVELPDREAMSVIGGGYAGAVYPDPDLVLPGGDERVSDPGMNK
jgi:hypothetical protein